MGSRSFNVDAYRSFTAPLMRMSREQVFASRSMKDYLNPYGVTLRESRDNDEHPESRAIILALDVTGSMGKIAEILAKKQLGTLVEGILERKPITDPQIMIMGIGDAYYDEAPLQVSQFESDIRIAQQLVDIWLEGHGGGNDCESYDLPWYFASQRTAIDCFEKRGQKGYLFTIGDEMPPSGIHKHHITKVFGGEQVRGYKPDETLIAAQEKYEVFHVIVEEGSYAQQYLSSVKRAWRGLLAKRAILLSNYDHLSQVILSVLEVAEGADPEDVIAKWQDRSVQKTVRHALFD